MHQNLIQFSFVNVYLLNADDIEKDVIKYMSITYMQNGIVKTQFFCFVFLINIAERRFKHLKYLKSRLLK